MHVGTQTRCKHVYLHVDRRFHLRGQGRGLVPVWLCSLKKKNLEHMCEKLRELNLETVCPSDECPLASRHTPWDQCPFYSPLF